MKLKTVAFILSIFAMVSCKKEETKIPLTDVKTKEKYDQIKELEWLVGDWENQQKDGALKLSWKKENDSAFVGNSYVFRGKDTLQSESMMLVQSGDSLRFVIMAGTGIVNGNENKEVLLTLKSFTGNQYVFENSKHDFPEKISYEKLPEDTLVSQTSGMKKGRRSIEEFKLVKRK